jgi:hypothetical protein
MRQGTGHGAPRCYLLRCVGLLAAGYGAEHDLLDGNEDAIRLAFGLPHDALRAFAQLRL